MSTINGDTQVWRIGRGRSLTLDQPRLMGILNVTPDSFSDGGAYADLSAAVDAALRMCDEGACIIDIGGESTRPGADSVPAQEQIRRTVPIISVLAKQCDVLISIDTARAEVARAALEAGAHIINDVSAGLDDADMLSLVADPPRRTASRATHGFGLILMHRLMPPKNDSYSDRYTTAPEYSGDVVGSVRRFLMERCEAAIAAGIACESIVIDPGLGFGKSVAQNYELIAAVREFLDLGFPVLSAASRKSFLAPQTGLCEPSPLPPKDRVHASVAVSVMQYLAGVRLFRVHDVAAHRQALAVVARMTAANHAPNAAS